MLTFRGGNIFKAGRVAGAALVVALAAAGAPNAPLKIHDAKPVSYALSAWIKSKYPLQAAAREYSTDPRSKRWALLIGLNDYASPTADNIGARQDAEGIRTMLVNQFGWRTDHIILIKDRDGSAQHIIDGIHWLALKTTSASSVVFHYSGHENFTRTTADGDNEARDVEIWGSDNRYILDGNLGKEMNRVAASHMWIDFSTCRAAGFDDAGMIKTGRILTYSSAESELSYEDPRLGGGHSIFTWYEVNVGIYGKHADLNGDGRISVEEAFKWSRPAVIAASGKKQYPVIRDYVSGEMFLTIPAH